MYDLPHTLDDDTYIADPRHPARLPKPSPQNLRKEARASQIRTARSAVRSCQRRGWDPGDIAKESYREMRARLGRGEHEAGGAWRMMTKDEKTTHFALAINSTDTKEEDSLNLNLNLNV